MKRLLAVLSLGITIALGQITPIAEIQYVADPATDDASPLLDQTVTVSGVVTAEYWGSYKNRDMIIQDADSAWSGIYAYHYSDNGWQDFPMTFDPGVDRTTIVEGDSVTLTAVVTEYHKWTELTNATALVVHGPAVNPPAPIEVSTLEANAEKYESVLIKVVDVDIVDPDMGYGEWSVTDGSGDLILDDKWAYYYYPKAGDSLATITGALSERDNVYKLLPRLARDVVEAGPFTRVQRVQQVLGSALVMTPDNPVLDRSYLYQDTVSCIGIVTVPTSELSSIDTSVSPWTGYMRFLWQDPNGGPYSSIMSYYDDPTAFPDLFEGDSVIMTGYILEYAGGGGVAQFTEMWITEPIQLVGEGAHVPDRPTVTTGDLRLPIDAEQWELNMVHIENATVIDNAWDPQYVEFTIDDGSGITIVDGDGTNSMFGEDQYGNPTTPFVPPPNGTTIASLDGYIYHSYGSYEDTTTYRIRPVYHSDLVYGGGPPVITGFAVTESPFGPDDAVTASATITDGSAVASAVITYRVDGGAWADAAMTKGADDTWSGTIPATGTEGALVEYYIEATDDGLDNQEGPMSSLLPSDTSKALYGYYTKADGPTIHDIQYTPFASGATYYVTAVVSVSGVVTSTANQPESRGGGFNIQDGPGIWNGIWAELAEAATYTVTQGDSITITGTVIEDYECTAISDVTAVTVHASGKSVAPLEITGAEFVADPEQYEGILLHFGEVTVIDSTSYDKNVTDDDGTTTFKIDDDFMIHESPDDMYYHALDNGAVIADLSGICHYYYGNHLVMIRDPADLGIIVSVVDGEGLPVKFSLSQNYPNPFNPTTTIEYSLARQVKHTLKVYNLRGALVATLVNDVRPAGAYSVTWNANNFASGIYFLRLDAEDFHQTKKLVLLK